MYHHYYANKVYQLTNVLGISTFLLNLFPSTKLGLNLGLIFSVGVSQALGQALGLGPRLGPSPQSAIFLMLPTTRQKSPPILTRLSTRQKAPSSAKKYKNKRPGDWRVAKSLPPLLCRCRCNPRNNSNNLYYLSRARRCFPKWHTHGARSLQSALRGQQVILATRSRSAIGGTAHR